MKGKMDYDFEYDILFFKKVNGTYQKSVECENIVIDIDKKGLVSGLQIQEASKFLEIPKSQLTKIPKWDFKALVQDGKIELRLHLKILMRNKTIEKHPIIMQNLSQSLPNSELVCEAS